MVALAINSKINPPYRADQVGTFLRPAELLAARAKHQKGEINAEKLRSVEDRYIIDLVAKQKKNGFRSITDGDFRRGHWFLDFLCGLDGVRMHYETSPDGFDAPVLEVVGKLKLSSPVCVDGYNFLKDLGVPEAKVCIPSPTLLHFGAAKNPRISKEAYPEGDAYNSAFFTDLAACYRAELSALYQAGCRYVQLDETSLALMCDPKFERDVISRGYDFDELLAQYVRLINDSLNFPERKQMTISMHSCRGNYRAMWLAEGSYDRVAKALFAEIKVDSHFLEFDNERSGGFEPLKYLAPNKTAVLGLITSKKPELEEKRDIVARIHDAAKIVPLDRLCLSAQCGFASTHHGNPLTEDAQWAKVGLICEIARSVWPEDA